MRNSAKNNRVSDRKRAHRTDWAKLKAKTDEEIEAEAAADPDSPPLTEEDLARMRPVSPVKRLRWRLGLSQRDFCSAYGLSLNSVRDWEQGRANPDQAAQTLLKLIAVDPSGIRRDVQKARSRDAELTF